jgi:two-component system LytT family response regulator
MLRAIIIDDEEAGIQTLKIQASRYPELFRIIASSLSPEEGIRLIEDYKPDLVFLDISMPTMTGFELLSRLVFRDFKLVFTTAHREYAIEAIKNRAFDYLLKPIDDEELVNCLNELLKQTNRKTFVSVAVPDTQLMEVQVKDGIMYLKQKEIIRLEASGSYTIFYLDSGTRHVASKGLADFAPRLDPNLFYRCHKSHIINLHKVQKFVNNKGFFAQMNDGSLADISRSHKDLFLERLKSI